MKKETLFFKNPPKIISAYSIVGPMEGKGPFGSYFDEVIDSYEWGEKSFEKTECKMHKSAIRGAVNKADLPESEIGAILGGDLLNQIVSTSYSAREFSSVFLGLYSACSTYAEAMIVGSLLVSGGYLDNVVCSTSSHFSSAERQYRFPLELGTPRTPLSQWTVTASGSLIMSKEGVGPSVTCATLGRIIDYGITDANNMGAAMAPAAAHTFLRHVTETERNPSYYDCIVTGDLGKYGSELFRMLCKEEGVYVGSNYFDCGAEIFGDDEKRYQGGSGAACGASVFNGFIYKKLLNGEFNRVLFMPTGALMSKDSSLQGESIPAITQAIAIENRG